MNGKKKGLKGFFGNLYLVVMLAFLYAPIVVLIIYSFNENKTMAKWGGFSLKWYEALFHDPMIMKALTNTLTIALLSAVIATVIGTFAAIGIHAMSRKKRTLILGITNLPVVNPDIVTGISLMLMFTAVGLSLGYGTLLLAHITFNIPYVILSVMPKLRQSNQSLYEAALDLGARPAYALWRITLPEISPGIITGAILAFTLSLDDFVVSLFTQQSVTNLSLYVYAQARRGISPKINALSAIMFIVVLVLLLVVNFRSNREKKKG